MDHDIREKMRVAVCYGWRLSFEHNSDGKFTASAERGGEHPAKHSETCEELAAAVEQLLTRIHPGTERR